MKYIGISSPLKIFKPVFFVWRICRWGITIGEIEQLQGYTRGPRDWGGMLFLKYQKFRQTKQES